VIALIQVAPSAPAVPAPSAVPVRSGTAMLLILVVAIIVIRRKKKRQKENAVPLA
jgi:hypothetical protein